MKPQITLVCVGKLREAFWADADAEYRKRLSGYTAKLVVCEVADEPTPDAASLAQEETVREKEAARILPKIEARDFAIILDGTHGKTLSSPAFSARLVQEMSDGASSFCFVIGGSLGLHPSVLERANLVLSLGPMTFPHQMMRVVLWEQVYRAFKIARNEPYHK